MIKSIFAAALLSTTLFTPVLAEELKMKSTINKVTVYPKGAQITRVVEGEVKQGEHVVVIEDLPGRIVPNSVRVEGSGDGQLEIGSVDVKQVYTSGEDKSSERKKIEDEIEQVNDEISALELVVKDANAQRALLKNLVQKAVAPSPKDNGQSAVIGAEQLRALMDLTGEQFREFTKVTEDARIKERKLHKKLEELHKKLSQLAPQQNLVTQVAINIDSEGDAVGKFKISYDVSEAGWLPTYDAKLSLGDTGNDSKVELVRRASVRQNTTESWDNVALTLSTARPKGNTQVPSLSPYILSEHKFIALGKAKRNVVTRQMAIQESAEIAQDNAVPMAAEAKVKASYQDAQEVVSGFLVEYNIGGKVTVTNAGSEKNVVIETKSVPAEISVHSVPLIDPSAYLTAKFKLESDAPWLPGQVTLSRDNVFLGKTRLPLLNPDQEYSLGFGKDDFVKIERVKVKEKKGESGIISSVNVEEREFITTIKNLHDFPIDVIVKDQLPYGTHEDIVVEMKSGSTKPSVKDVDKQRGILAWEHKVAGKEEDSIKFGYKVTWPKDMQITPVR